MKTKDVGSAVAFYKKSLIFEKSYRFSLRVIELHHKLKEINEYQIGAQLIRSGTSIGANIMEASAAYSKKEFGHKMSIASKEAREALYWLSLINDSKVLPDVDDSIIAECTELIKMLTVIVKKTDPR